MNAIFSPCRISNIEVNNPALPNGSVCSYKKHLHKVVTTDADGATHSCMLVSFCDQQEVAGSCGELHNLKCCSKTYKLPGGRQ